MRDPPNSKRTKQGIVNQQERKEDMKRLKLKKITSVLMAAAIVMSSITFSSTAVKAAAVNVEGTEEIKGSTWGVEGKEGQTNPNNPNNTHYYGSFEDDKATAFKIPDDDKSAPYGMKFETTGDTDFTVEQGTGTAFPSALSNAGLGSSLYDNSTNWLWFNVKNNASGSIRVKWSNLKIYKKSNDEDNKYAYVNVDVVRTLSYTLYNGQKTVDIPQEGKDPVTVDAYVGMGPGLTATAFIGVSEVRVQNDFYLAGTDTKEYLYTNVTLTDIDDGQYIAVKETEAQYEFVSRNTKLTWGEDGDGDNTRSVYYYPDMVNESGGAETAAGFLFHGYGFDYTFGRVVKDGEGHVTVPSGSIQYVGTGQSMAPLPLPPANKTVSDNSAYYDTAGNSLAEKDVYQNHIKDVKKSWTYEITQPVPTDTPENFYLDGFQMNDDVDSCLAIESAKVYYGMSGTSDDKDVSSWFNISTANNKVSATLKNPDNADFYSHSIYRLVIKVHLAGTENWDNLSEQAKIALEDKWDKHHSIDKVYYTTRLANKETTVWDGNTTPSNEVYTDVLINPMPTKSVSDSDEMRVVENHCRNVMDTWTYRVSQVVPVMAGNFGGYDQFELIDEVEDCMEIKSVKVEQVYKDRITGVADAGTDVSSWFNISTTNNRVVAALKAKGYEANKEFYGRPQAKELSYELVVEVGLKGVDNWESMTDAEKTALENVWKSHGHYNTTETTITEYNTAQRIIDGDARTTNRTTTVVDLSTDANGTPGLAITKDVNRYEHQVGDIVSYTVTVWNTNPKADTAGFKVWDTTLPDSMELDFDSVKVTGISSDNYTLTKQGNGWVLKSKGTYALPYGTKIVITYDAKALIPSNGTLVDNTASATAIGIPEKSDSEQVYINSPKNIVVKTAPHTKYKVGDTVGYDVTITNFNPGTFMRNVVLTDVVDTPGLSIKEGSVAVLVGGRDVTSQVDVVFDDDGKGFTIKTPFNLYNGDLPVLTDACTNPDPYTSITHWTDKIKVTYDATITDEAALEENLQNTFTAPATPNTNGDVIRDDDTIPSGGGSDDEAIPMKKPMLDIVKSSNKQTYKVGETGKYTLKVTQTKEDLTAKNVVVKDTFMQQEGMEIDAASIKVLFNKDDITKQCTIITGKTAFEIQTGRNLTDEDLLTVTYDVTFTQTGTYDNNAVASSDNTDNADDDNEVVVEDKTPMLHIMKKSDKKNYRVGDTGQYTLDITETIAGAVAKNVAVEDAFVQKDGLQVDTGSIKVVLNGVDITAGCVITADNTAFKIQTGRDLTDADLLTVTYDVTFTQAGTYDNVAVTSADNANDDDDDDNEVVVEDITPQLEIKKTSDKQSYRTGETGTYTLLVSQSVKNAVAKNVVITDAFAQKDGLLIRKKSMKIYLNGKDITKQCGIESDKRDFKIETGKDLTSDDVIKVIYNVKFSRTGTYHNTAVADADNADHVSDDNTVTVDKPVPGISNPNPNPTPGRILAPQTGGKVLTCALLVVLLASASVVIWCLRRKSQNKTDGQE